MSISSNCFSNISNCNYSRIPRTEIKIPLAEFQFPPTFIELAPNVIEFPLTEM